MIPFVKRYSDRPASTPDRLGPFRPFLWLALVSTVSLAADRPNPKSVARDFDEVVIADFEHGVDPDQPEQDQGISIEADSPKASRGKGCLKVALPHGKAVRLGFIIPSDKASKRDWLEYDLIGVPEEGVLIETTLFEEESRRPLGRAATVAQRSPWCGQILLAELTQGPVSTDLRVVLRLTSLACESAVYFDAVRVVRDRPPKVPEDSGGAYHVTASSRTMWPGFEPLEPDRFGSQNNRWHWESEGHPQISLLEYPDPVARTMVGEGSLDAPDPAFGLSLQLRPGHYEGVILAAPITTCGIRRPRYSLRCNAMELANRDVRPERLLSEEGVFMGRSARDFSAEAVRRLWVDDAFLVEPFSVATRDGLIVFGIEGAFLSGVVVYPKNLSRVYRPYLESLDARRRAYFEQQVYSCVPPSRVEPPDVPTEEENQNGFQILTANPSLWPAQPIALTSKNLVRRGVETFALPGQTVSVVVGALARVDLQNLHVSANRPGNAESEVMELRDFPCQWRPPVRRSLPFWLAPVVPQSLKRGRIAWYVLSVHLSRGMRAKDVTVALKISASKRPAAFTAVRIAMAPVDSVPDNLCRGVLYPREWENGYVLGMLREMHRDRTDEYVLQDYRLLGEFGVSATVIRGVHSTGASESGVGVDAALAARQAHLALRGGLCHGSPGWVDFSQITMDRQWRRESDEDKAGPLIHSAGQLRNELRRMNIRASALLLEEFSTSGHSGLPSSRELLGLVRMLREGGWSSVGVLLDRLGPDGPGDRHEVGPDNVGDAAIRWVGQLDRVAAPGFVIEKLRKRFPKLDYELFDLTGGRFSAGFRLWIDDLNGFWTGCVHRPTAPYHPIQYTHPVDVPLLMPYPGQSSPTLRLLAIREGEVDCAYPLLLARLLGRAHTPPELAIRGKRALETARKELMEAWQAAVRPSDDEPEAREEGELPPLPRPFTPPCDLMDKHRRVLFDLIVELTRGR